MIVSLRHALAFLTRFPVGSHPQGQDELAKSVPFFPIVGLLVGGLGAGAFAGGTELFNPAIGAVSCLLVTAAVTGGLHEDGLADSMDALGGGWNREQRMEKFKDSRHGTFGVLALVLVSLAKFSALNSLSGWLAAGAIVAAHVLGRSAAVVAMAVLPAAQAEGLSAAYGRSLPLSTSVAAAVLGLVVAVIVFGIWMLVPIVAVIATSLMVSVWAVTKIGGSTGDVLGAVEQAGECAVLLSAVAVLL